MNPCLIIAFLVGAALAGLVLRVGRPAWGPTAAQRRRLRAEERRQRPQEGRN